MERKALGKGINALFAERELEKTDELSRVDKEVNQGERIVYLKLNQVKPNPFQPREYFDPESLKELKQSIKEKGIIQPILVRRKGDAYELIAGERRFRAASLLELGEIPAIVKEIQDEDSLELALIENIQRQDLNPIEEARAYRYLIEKFQLTQERISEIIGKSRVSITNTLRLLKLPQEVQEEIRNGRLSFAHGRALLELDDPNHQRRLTLEIISKRLSISELDSLIKMHKPKNKLQKIRQSVIDPVVSVYEEALQHSLATKVRINKKKKRGTIIIDFYSQIDLERIVHKLKGDNQS
ncbi:MAG: ParB/RepB/Spo0J family partition protein [Candidatus Omnitrophota bacterium]